MRLFAFLVLLVGSIAHAQTETSAAAQGYKSELSAGAYVSVNSDHYGSTSGTTARDAFDGQIGVVYGRFFTSAWEGVASVRVVIDSSDASSSNYSALVGVAYNFFDDTANSIYLRGLVGPNVAKTESDHTYLSALFDVAVGKRVQLFPSVSWNPEIEVYSRTKATSHESMDWQRASYTSYRVMPFQLTLLF